MFNSIPVNNKVPIYKQNTTPCYRNKFIILNYLLITKTLVMPSNFFRRILVIALVMWSNCLSAQMQPLINEPVDISPEFRNFANTYFLADSLQGFNTSNVSGTIKWQRNRYSRRMAFDNELAVLSPDKGVVFPQGEYAVNPVLPFSIQFVSPRTLRLRVKTGTNMKEEKDSLMLVKEPATDNSWKYSKIKGGHQYTSAFGSVTILEYPWRIEVRDAIGKLLTSTNHAVDNEGTYTPVVPFSYMQRSTDMSKSFAASFTLSAGEKIFGCGESFSRLDKRGQKIVLWTDDANGVQNPTMYKPIPFFMSSNGYGMFMHTSTPITCDIGASFNAVNTIMIGDDELDLFIFIGSPKEILNEYTTLTGKSPMPPLWSFGLWMSRITYSSEKEVRDISAKLRQNRIPSDVIHLDVGWFETDWRTDYKFSTSRFTDATKMIADLKNVGHRISLWQLPYFVPKNRLYPEIINKDLYVRDAKGNSPYEDVVLDFSNPAAVQWYQNQLDTLLRMGVSAIKVDFGEAAPPYGLYHSGKTGFYEHNLYPVRYNKAVADITKKVTGDNIIWARSAWAGSQRYPVHWGGDAENTSNAMLATLRGGLSFGLSGFAFWSHDIGGFVLKTPEELYRRWTPFGFLSSHTRSHGTPPKEPWEYSKSFLDEYRLSDEMKYKLMPYVYAQAKQCSENGLPMVRALFVEYPDDPGAWQIEDEYLFGSDILVAPFFQDSVYERDVYLPKGKWINYQSGEVYNSGWNHIKGGKIAAVILVRDGAAIPHIKLAQSTKDMDWKNIEWVVYSTGNAAAKGLVCLPSDNVLHAVSVENNRLASDPYNGSVKWNIHPYKNNK
ncbi:MAG TPA: alpha-xylosidase [Candidatus Saccharimonadales bacterium]|jgi:alpha-D-xyloside xylohydrolase